MARPKRSDVWAHWVAPGAKAEAGEAAPGASIADAPEPAERTHLEPLFPPGGIPFTPTSPCPHRCKLCAGTGGFIVFATGERLACPDCEGTGDAGIPAGSAFVCMVCHRAGKDGSKALPADVEPLPPGPPMDEDDEGGMSNRERARLKAYVEKVARKLEGRSPPCR